MKLISTKSKLIIMIFGLVAAVSLLITMVFMTQYSNVHVIYQILEDGTVEIGSGTQFVTGDYKLDNQYLYRYLNSTTKPTSPVTEDFETAKTIIYDFQMSMNSFNNFILATFVVCICMFALLLIFANHSRRVYYTSNLVVGIGAPVVSIIMALIGMIWNIILLGTFNSHADLFKVTSIMEDFNIDSKTKLAMRTTMSYEDMINDYASNVNSLTLVLTIIYFVILLVAACFVIVNTVLKYKATKQAREEIIARAKGGLVDAK